MNVIRCKVGQFAEVVNINSGLESLQSEVGGYIEACYPFEDEVAIICNEEGKYNGMMSNRGLTVNGELIDIIFGDFLIVGLTKDNFGELSVELAAKYFEKFLVPELIYFEHGQVKIKQMNIDDILGGN